MANRFIFKGNPGRIRPFTKLGLSLSAQKLTECPQIGVILGSQYIRLVPVARCQDLRVPRPN
jgi:hypothetical protein